MTYRRYIVLILMAKIDANFLKLAHAGLKRDIDPNARAAWFDANGVGIFVSTAKRSSEIFAAALPRESTSHQRSNIQDVMVLEIGPDALGRDGSRATDWLSTHPYVHPAH